MTAGANVTLITANTVNMLNDDAHQAIIGWLETLAGLPGAPQAHW